MLYSSNSNESSERNVTCVTSVEDRGALFEFRTDTKLHLCVTAKTKHIHTHTYFMSTPRHHSLEATHPGLHIHYGKHTHTHTHMHACRLYPLFIVTHNRRRPAQPSILETHTHTYIHMHANYIHSSSSLMIGDPPSPPYSKHTHTHIHIHIQTISTLHHHS